MLNPKEPIQTEFKLYLIMLLFVAGWMTANLCYLLRRSFKHETAIPKNS
jgi:hypothetical protein